MARRGDLLRGWLTRPAMLLVWALVFWGTLLALSTVHEALGEGVPSAWTRLWPGDSTSPWAWLNVGCVGLAIVTWSAVVGFVVLSRLGRPGETPAD